MVGIYHISIGIEHIFKVCKTSGIRIDITIVHQLDLGKILHDQGGTIHIYVMLGEGFGIQFTEGIKTGERRIVRTNPDIFSGIIILVCPDFEACPLVKFHAAFFLAAAEYLLDKAIVVVIEALLHPFSAGTAWIDITDEGDVAGFVIFVLPVGRRTGQIPFLHGTAKTGLFPVGTGPVVGFVPGFRGKVCR